MQEVCKYECYWFNTPTVNGFETSNVVDPKSIILNALKALDHLMEPLAEFSLAALAGDYACTRRV